MKFRITMKDPDGVNNGVEEAVKSQTAGLLNLDDDEREAVREIRRDKIQKSIRRWFEYGEYLTVEIDTEAGTVRAVPTDDL